jgi:hypothetical protein
MLYTLMHKKIPVADIEIDSETAHILSISKVHNIERVPIGIEVKDGVISRKSLNDWWLGRSIPASRSELDEALRIMNIYSTKMLLEKSFGLSLSDQYWINKHEKPLDWDKINFFFFLFSEDVGNALFGQAAEGEMDLISPDNTSDGWLKKKWIIANGKRMLLKGGSNPAQQEPLNEVLASMIMRRLNIPHVNYTLAEIDGLPIGLCENFITPETELVNAWHIFLTGKKRQNHISIYEHFLNACEVLGIPNMRKYIDEIIVVDFLIANTDRHFGNFGAVRNACTLEWLGASPVFDCGTSMWHNEFTHNIHYELDIKCKPFKAYFSEQIKLVNSFDWVNFDNLKGIDEEFKEIYKPSKYMDKARIDKLLFSLKKRIEMLKRIHNVNRYGMRTDN